MGVLGRPYMIPATVLLSNEIPTIYNYTESVKSPTASLTPVKSILGTNPTPFMASFTSRGPSAIEPNVLKPDITAPGLNIVAAWSEGSSPLNVPADDRVVKYQIDSGTSMSCPHVSAVAALLKAIHPDWSSAAIRSALITSSKSTNNQGKTITDSQGNSSTPFDFGAGHIQPSMAADVGPGKSYYTVKINQPAGYTVEIEPTALSFNAAGENQSFNVTVKAGSSAVKNEYAFGSFVWSDGTHLVTSPIAVSTA